jgi:MurNAc alpha-1-phosphate uridylyltransferase
MILAAGRGERMRPLSDVTPKPLLRAGGKPLIVWQLEALARAGFRDIAINVSHGADSLVAALGDGSAHGVRIAWSRETEPLETAGGIATASPLLAAGAALIVSGDIWTRFDYASLRERVAEIQPGKVLYEMDGVEEALAREAFALAAAKLPLKTIFVHRLVGG